MNGRARRAVLPLGWAGAAALGAHVLPGAVAWRRARCLLLPGLSGVGRSDHVALTFDDGPDPVSTPLILDALETLGWRATFFCLASQAKRSPGLTRELLARGHEIGVHGFAHTSHMRRHANWAVRDVTRARDTISNITGQPLRWFRPPYGALSASSLVAARRTRLQLVLWTTWGRDWRPDATGETVAFDVCRTFHEGATVLLHDSDVTSTPGSWRATVAALPMLADSWSAAGLQVGTLTEHGIHAR